LAEFLAMVAVEIDGLDAELGGATPGLTLEQRMEAIAGKLHKRALHDVVS
jgi:hypothetical protein